MNVNQINGITVYSLTVMYHSEKKRFYLEP